MSLIPDRPLIPGPIKEFCQCGCSTFGARRKKRWTDGLQHVNGCPCRRCQGSRHKKNAGARERRIEKATGLERSPSSGAVSGFDFGGVCAVEETANKSLVRGLRSWWASVQIQKKMARLLQIKHKPIAFVASWEIGGSGARPRLVVMPFESWNELQQKAAAWENSQ